MPAAPNPPSPAQTVRILTLHAKGMGRNEIARKIGVTTYYVDKVVKAQNGTFDRSGQMLIATAVVKADLARRRAALSLQLLKNAQTFAAQVNEPMEVFSFGGKDNTFASETVSRPPTASIRDLTASAQMAAKTSLELERADNDEAAGEKSLLSQLGIGLGLIQPQNVTPDTTE